jgi:hypothetical protein
MCTPGRLAGAVSGSVAVNMLALGSKAGVTTISGIKGLLNARVPGTLTLGAERAKVPWFAASCCASEAYLLLVWRSKRAFSAAEFVPEPARPQMSVAPARFLVVAMLAVTLVQANVDLARQPKFCLPIVRPIG